MAASSAATTASAAEPPLKFYQPRTKRNLEGNLFSWFAVVPPVPPSSAMIDAAVAKLKEGDPKIVKIERADTSPPEDVEGFHVTILARIREKDEKHQAYLKRTFELASFTAADVRPKIDPNTGQHKFVILQKGGMLYVIFEYEESTALHKWRETFAKVHCEEDFQVHGAHVTAVYATLQK